MQNLKPMGAVAALYANDQQVLSEAIIASLSGAIFEGSVPKPASRGKLLLGRIAHKVVQWTTQMTKSQDRNGAEVTLFHNSLFESSGHPYAHSLLKSSTTETVALVEGGDPMNGPYLMLSPEIRKNGSLWDRIFFDSVQSADVQVRFVHETLATYQTAKNLLEQGAAVRIKAVAAGTGLSLILVYDKLIREGFAPSAITALITDRDPLNTAKSNRLLGKLASTRRNRFCAENNHGIVAVAEDLFADSSELSETRPYDIVTAIGILEYFQGVTHSTTEQRLMLADATELRTAHDLAERLAAITVARGSLIINTYRDHAAIRILELFGKRFDFRNREHLSDLLAPMNFRSRHLAGSGHIYDVEVFEKLASVG